MTSNLNLLSQQKVDSEHEAEVSGLKLLLHLTNMNFYFYFYFFFDGFTHLGCVVTFKI